MGLRPDTELRRLIREVRIAAYEAGKMDDQPHRQEHAQYDRAVVRLLTFLDEKGL